MVYIINDDLLFGLCLWFILLELALYSTVGFRCHVDSSIGSLSCLSLDGIKRDTESTAVTFNYQTAGR